MKETKLKLFIILFVVVTLISTVVFATEPTNDAGEPVTTSETAPEGDGTQPTEETNIEDGDRYFAGDSVEITTLIDSNAFAVGKDVTLTGQVGGDLFVIANKLTIAEGSAVYGNVFAVASEIEIDGQIYDLYGTCDKLTIEYNGYVYRDLRAMATEVFMNGVVGRNVFVEADKVVLNKDCIINGNLNCIAQSETIYIDSSNNESTTIPKDIVKGENQYTKRDKKLFNSKIEKSVNSILKSNKINNDMSGDKIKSIITSYVFNVTGIKTNSEVKTSTNQVLIPKLYIYIDIVVIIVLILGIVLPRVINKKDSTEKETKA